jgi:hypothetical protein
MGTYFAGEFPDFYQKPRQTSCGGKSGWCWNRGTGAEAMEIMFASTLRQRACAALVAWWAVMATPFLRETPPLPPARLSQFEAIRSSTTEHRAPQKTYVTFQDALVVELLRVRQSMADCRSWQESDYRMASEILASLILRDAASSLSRHEQLREDLLRVSEQERQRPWFRNNQALLHWLAEIKEQTSPLHPDHLYSIQSQMNELPLDYASLERKVALATRPHWRSLLNKWQTIDTALQQVPRIEVPTTAAQLYQEIKEYDGIPDVYVRDKGAVVRLLLLCKLYAQYR